MELNGVRIPKGYNGVGLHDTAGNTCGVMSRDEARVHARMLREHGVTAYKLLVADTNKVQRAAGYVDEGLLVAVRFYEHQPWGRPPGAWVTPGDQIRPYHDVGVQLMELGGNEPNIQCEWADEKPPKTYSDVARAMVEAWEVMLARAAEVPGIAPMWPAHTPSSANGWWNDHRAGWTAARAMLLSRGLLESVRHVAIHPRPLNNPPDTPWSATNTCTWKEWQWFALNFAPEAYYWATEHGYALGDSQNADWPRIDLPLWQLYNWELFTRMYPKHPLPHGPRMAGAFYWIHDPFGHHLWRQDALTGSGGAGGMPDPSPLWVQMQEQAWALRFERYPEGEEPPIEPPEPPAESTNGIDISWYQRTGTNWAEVERYNTFCYIRASYGLNLDPAVFGHTDQAAANARSVRRGYYHYLTAANNAETQARFFAALCRSLPAHELFAVDIEDEGLTVEKVRTFLLTFEEEWGEPGRIYTREEYWRRKFGHELDTLAGRWGLWVADHRDRPEPAIPSPWKVWQVWQYGVKLGPEHPSPIDRNRMRAEAEPPEPPEPPGPPDSLQILDRQGNVRDWNWLTGKYNLQPTHISQGRDWRLTEIREGGFDISCTVYAPPGTVVRLRWADGEAFGVVEPKAEIGMAMGSCYAPPFTGPYTIVTGDAEVRGLGWLCGTNHEHVDLKFVLEG